LGIEEEDLKAARQKLVKRKDLTEKEIEDLKK